MTEGRANDEVSSEPAIEPEPIKDLDVDETQTAEVRGGQSAGATRPGSVGGQ